MIQRCGVRMTNKEKVIKDCKNTILNILSTEDLDSKISKLQKESEIIVELMENLIYENSRKMMNQDEYNKKYNSYTEKYEKIKSKLSKLENKKQDLKVRRDKIKIFIEDLKSNDKLIDEFDERLWYAMVDKIVVRKEENIGFQFRNSN